jgi:hypothetical protein
MIDTIVAQIASQLTSRLPWLVEVKSIGRQDPSGILVKEDGEEWIGIDDRWLGRMYIRFRDGAEMSYADARVTSAPNISVTAKMRGVFMHNCKNELEVSRWLSYAIADARGYELRYRTMLKASSTDKQYIFKEETKRPEGMKNNDLRLILVDFDIVYRDAIVLTNDCVPDCHEC